MSIESEILRIQKNIADTYAVVAEKGGSVPLAPISANLAGAVRSIPASGGVDNNPVGTVISFMGKTPLRDILSAMELCGISALTRRWPSTLRRSSGV